MDEQAAADALWEAADADGAVWQVGLPKPVLDAMQRVVDTAVWTCPHVEAAADLPPGALPKLTIAGGRAISCLELACLGTMHDVSYQRQLRACVLCGHRVPTYRPMFTDEACALSMLAWVCYPCAKPGGQLAAWAGVPDR